MKTSQVFLMIPVRVVGNTNGNIPLPGPLGSFFSLFPMFPITYLKIMDKGKRREKATASACIRVKFETTIGNTTGNRRFNVREKTIEGKLVKAVKIMGGLAPKFVSPGLDGVPDRLVLLPGGKIAFIELKAPGKELRPLQVRRKRQLESLGFLVYCIDRPEQIGEILNEIQSS